MKALFFRNELQIKDIPVPKRAPGEALIKVLMAGICSTDIEIVRGYMGFEGILGHEFVGQVIESDSPQLMGDRVVGEINVGCGVCSDCLAGLERHCQSRSVVGIQNHAGAFAEYITLPDKNLHKIPDSVSTEAAVFTEPIAAAFEILEQVHLDPSLQIAIIGDGKLALLITQVLLQTGCSVTVIGKHESKLALARKYGARTIFETTPEQRFDVVVEASGHTSGFSRAIEILRPRGTLIFKSTYRDSLNFNPATIVINELRIIGSRCGPFPPAIRSLEQGRINPIGLISKTVPMEQALDAFEDARQSASLKVLLTM